MKKLLFLLVILPFALAAQDDKDKRIKDGFAIHGGLGLLYGGYGGAFEYQVKLKDFFRISPFIGIGIAEGDRDSANTRHDWFASSAGVNFEFGKKMHRVFFGPYGTIQNVLRRSDEYEKTFMPSWSFIVGYRGTAKFGLIWQVYIGNAMLQSPFELAKKFYANTDVGLGLGFKF